MKKIFPVLFTLLLFSFCNANETGTDLEKSEPESSSVPFAYARPSSESNTGYSAAPALQQTETVTLMYYGAEAEHDALSDEALGAFGLAVKIKPYPADYTELLAVLSSDPPDMFMMVLSPARLAELTSGGYIREIPDEFIDSSGKLSDYVHGNMTAEANRQIYGAYAYLPCDYDLNPAYAADSHRFFYRKDWAETLGLGEPQNPGDLYVMAKAFASQQNPNRADQTMLTGMTVPSPEYFAALYGYDLTGWTEENGRYIPAYYSDGMLPMLNYARRLHDEGVFKFTRDAGNAANLNDSGILVAKADSPEAFGAIIQPVADELNIPLETALEENVGIMTPPRDPDAPKVWKNNFRPEGWLFSRHVQYGLLERMVDFLDYTLTDEARTSSRYGIPNVTYTQNQDGIFMFTDPETYASYDLLSMYPTGGFLNLLTGDASRYADANYPSEISYAVRSLYNEGTQKYYTPSAYYDILRRNVNSPLRDALNIDAAEHFYGIITGSDPAEEMFGQFREACRGAGVEAVIEEVNS